MTQPRQSSTNHARHDRLVVIRYLDHDDDLLAGEVSQARALLASCPDCAALASELALISDATLHMALPPRTRDFRLTPQQAASLRPNGLRAILQRVAAGFRVEFVRPLAGAALAVGLLLAVVGGLPNPGASTADLAAGAAGNPSRVGNDQAATAAPIALPAASAEYGASAVPPIVGTTTNGASQLPQMSAESSAPAPQGTGKEASSSPHSPTLAASAGTAPLDTSTAQPPVPATPAAASTTTAVALGTAGTTPAPVAQGNSGSVQAVDTAASSGGLPPLVILGVLLASLGLIVFLLTFVARRMGRSAG